MSKAFTSEETPEPTSATREPPRLRPGEVRYVTPEGQAALRAELDRLRAGPPEASAGEERARRISFLERMLGLLTVLGPEGVPEGQAGFGSWVTVEDEEGARATWRLVGPDEADARRRAVSVHAPLGRALLGRRAGDEVEVERPDGSRTYKVVAVHGRRPGEGAGFPPGPR